jgi:hypothetical protein
MVPALWIGAAIVLAGAAAAFMITSRRRPAQEQAPEQQARELALAEAA